MTNTLPNPVQRRKGIFYLILPLVVLPLLLLCVNLLYPVKAEDHAFSSRLNPQIPAPNLEELSVNKAEAYHYVSDQEKVKVKEDWTIPIIGSIPSNDQDSWELYPEQFKTEQLGNTDTPTPSRGFLATGQNSSVSTKRDSGIRKSPQNQAEEIKKQVQELELMMQVATEVEADSPAVLAEGISVSSSPNPELERLEELMNSFESKTKQSDPELEQLDQLMEKLLDLQYPERVIQKMNQQEIRPFLEEENEEQVRKDFFAENIHLSQTSGFYGLEADRLSGAESPRQSTLKVLVHETQELIPGQSLKLKLQEEMSLKGMVVPKGTELHAKTQLVGDRLLVKLTGMFWQEQFHALKLEGYGLDGMPGIGVGGLKGGSQLLAQGQRQALNLNLGGLGMGMEGQLANAGLSAGRGFLQSKSGTSKVTIKSGFQLVLIDFSTN